MLVRICLMTGDANEILAETKIDAVSLMVAAESREPQARAKGRAWTASAVPFFAQEMITSVRSGKAESLVEMDAVNAAMDAWLCDSIYDGVKAEEFVASDLIFTVLPDGAVKYDRVPARTM